MFQAVGEATALNLELFVGTRPFPELDNDGVGDGQLAEGPHIGAEAVRQHIGVAAIILGPGDREAVAKAVELYGVDGINIETALEQGLDDRPVRRLDGDMNLARVASTRLQQPGNHVGEAGPAMREPALSDLVTSLVAQRNDMLLRAPVNPNEPSSFFIHHALSGDWAQAPVDRARKQSSLTATPACSCTGALGAISPLGIGHGRFAGARVHIRCFPIRIGAPENRWLLPANRLGPER